MRGKRFAGDDGDSLPLNRMAQKSRRRSHRRICPHPSPRKKPRRGHHPPAVWVSNISSIVN